MTVNNKVFISFVIFLFVYLFRSPNKSVSTILCAKIASVFKASVFVCFVFFFFFLFFCHI